MADLVVERRGVPVLVCAEDGVPIAGEQDALDLIGAAFTQADVVALPVGRLDERFFALHTGVAGEIMQKFTNYRIRLAIVGDVSAQVEASAAMRAMVSETNQGSMIWFVADLAELDARLA
jgi:hypothetical protein